MTDNNVISYCIVDERAVMPKKSHESDIGYDLTAVGIFKSVSESITLFETGIVVSPPDGYYIEIVPRSSISKSGYMLANSIGVIDPSYSGSLKIALIKVDKSLPDIQTPFTLCQIVMRKAEYATLRQVSSVKETQRGEGGFGSTNKFKKSEEIGGHRIM